MSSRQPVAFQTLLLAIPVILKRTEVTILEISLLNASMKTIVIASAKVKTAYLIKSNAQKPGIVKNAAFAKQKEALMLDTY